MTIKLEQLMTAAGLLASSEYEKHCELIAGELRMMSPSGWRHSHVSVRLGRLLDAFVQQHQLGMCFGAEGGFFIERDPDTVLAPDVAFVAKENIPAELSPTGFWPGAPDLAVEVVSPNDRAGDIDDKISRWFATGVQELWLVDPMLRTVTVYFSLNEVVTFAGEQTFDNSRVLPGFACRLAEIFSGIDP